MAKTTGLASITQGRSDIHRIDPSHINVKDSWNGRDFKDPDNIAHVNELAASIAEIGVLEPLTVYMEKGKVWLSDGECRLRAVLQAKAAGAPIQTVPVKSDQQHINEGDRVFGQILRNSGKPFSDIELARTFRRLLDFGWQQGDIAKKWGKSEGRVSQILKLLTLSNPIQTMIVKQEVTPSLAVAVNKAAANPTEAEKQLKAGLEQAKANGQTTVKPVHLEAAGVSTKVSLKTLIKDAFEYSDVDNDQEEFVIIKMPLDKWRPLADELGL